MLIYHQKTGELVTDAGFRIGTGYSGHGVGVNNPDLQEVHNVGPLPRGVYNIKSPIDTEKHGPFALPLEPHQENVMFGRSEFLIHGDSINHPGQASTGCIIVARSLRERINNLQDRRLVVLL